MDEAAPRDMRECAQCRQFVGIGWTSSEFLCDRGRERGNSRVRGDEVECTGEGAEWEEGFKWEVGKDLGDDLEGECF